MNNTQHIEEPINDTKCNSDTEYIVKCIDQKLNSMSLKEKEDYFSKFGFQLVKIHDQIEAP